MTNKSHLRLDQAQIKSLYQAKCLTAPGYLYLWLLSIRAPGWKYRIRSVREFCQEIGMHRSTYYRAIAQLIEEGLIEAEEVGGMDITIKSTPEDEDETPPAPEPEPRPQPGDTRPQSRDSGPQPGDTRPQSRDKQRPKPKQGNGSTTLQISNNSLTPLSQPTEDDFEQRPTAAQELDRDQWLKFKGWLKAKCDRLPLRPDRPDKWIAAMMKRPEMVCDFLKFGDVAPPEPADDHELDRLLITNPKAYLEAIAGGLVNG